MTRLSAAIDQLPFSARQALSALGENLRIARLRRNESLKDWADRIGVSVPTLMRVEKGDPTVGLGIVAAALHAIDRQDALPALADPHLDTGAVAMEVQAAQDRGRPAPKRRRR